MESGGICHFRGSCTFDPLSNSMVALAANDNGSVAADAIRIVGGPGGATDIAYLHNDHLGTPQVMTDAAAQVLWWRDQTPFGQTVAEGGFTSNPLRFPGQYADAESGLAYNYFRDYDPALGRYIQSDPIGLGGGLNTYGYVGGNPMARVDPKGLDSESLGAIGDFIRNYNEMRSANTVGADKFFHCKAACEAAQRGERGYETARNLSDYREWFDQNVKGDSLQESEADQFANCYGRIQGTRRPNTPCHYICEPFRPKEGGVPVR